MSRQWHKELMALAKDSEGGHQVKRILELLRLRAPNTEMTARPFWYVAQSRPGGQIILAGIWFNRADAEEFLQRRRYRFPKSAHVYCGSLCDESHLAEIYQLADEVTS